MATITVYVFEPNTSTPCSHAWVQVIQPPDVLDEGQTDANGVWTSISLTANQWYDVEAEHYRNDADTVWLPSAGTSTNLYA
ncbi:MAG: hypothetical protein HY706_17930 [Candidatus Hydrogenedentes bacterium]|nr:hypothetical protein [Candidatus Hydrogenedentota bacterium]